MKKSIISLCIFMGIFTFLLFKAEQFDLKISDDDIAVNEITHSSSAVTDSVQTNNVTAAPVYITVDYTEPDPVETSTEASSTTTATESKTTAPVAAVNTEKENKPTVTAEPPEDAVPAGADPEDSASEPPPPPAETGMTYLGSLKITGYVATGNKTASGVYPYVGGVAMSRQYGLPYGTKIYIEGLGYFTLNDTGCKYGVVDVFRSTVSECYALTSYANVYVVNE